ncbi:MAG: glycosyltransferase [Bacteroidota bacterium]
MPVFNEKINTTILIAPLDWGLGHATRCIPIIRYLLQKQCRVILATSGYHQVLLQQEFPGIQCIQLDGYGIIYGKKNVLLRLALQLPHFLRNVKKENKWLEKIIDNYQIDAVISDNRYGLYTSKIPCVFITHQLQVKAPQFFKWVEGFSRKRLYLYINRFTECWVPDAENVSESLAGTLSHPKVLPGLPVKYIGWLTRFKVTGVPRKKYMATISLSGPEPQRSLLEAIILPQLKNAEGHFLLIRGMPGETTLPLLPANISVVNHLGANDMQLAFSESNYIISRSGYSTLMDMKVLQCKCIFIPTPGQTEQEYLGECLATKKMAIVKRQEGFDLLKALTEAAHFDFKLVSIYQNQLLEPVINNWLTGLKYSS